ncbi:MAG TPA: hypothetical protein DIS66_06860, partial [Candidatus Omnitrophica bacterium]|nr:hypothetical protein [Candidatus Omnitrophota bacterium]
MHQWNDDQYWTLFPAAVKIYSDMEKEYDLKTGKFRDMRIDQSNPRVQADVAAILYMIQMSGLPLDLFTDHYGDLIARFRARVEKSEHYKITEAELMQLWSPSRAERVKVLMNQTQAELDKLPPGDSTARQGLEARMEQLKTRYYGIIDPLLRGIARGDASFIVNHIYFGMGLDDSAELAAWKALPLDERAETMEKLFDLVDKLSGNVGKFLGLDNETDPLKRMQIQGELWAIARDLLEEPSSWEGFFNADGTIQEGAEANVKLFFDILNDPVKLKEIESYLGDTDAFGFYGDKDERNKKGVISTTVRNFINENIRRIELKGKSTDGAGIFESGSALKTALNSLTPTGIRAFLFSLVAVLPGTGPAAAEDAQSPEELWTEIQKEIKARKELFEAVKRAGFVFDRMLLGNLSKTYFSFQEVYPKITADQFIQLSSKAFAARGVAAQELSKETRPDWMSESEYEIYRTNLNHLFSESSEPISGAPAGAPKDETSFWDAVQLFTDFINDQKRFEDPAQRRPFTDVVDWVQTHERARMKLQAVYMAYHTDSNGLAVKASPADLSSWISGVLNGSYSEAEFSEVLFLDGIFQSGERNLLKKVKERLSDETSFLGTPEKQAGWVAARKAVLTEKAVALL